jgi:hypothetical protein
MSEPLCFSIRGWERRKGGGGGGGGYMSMFHIASWPPQPKKAVIDLYFFQILTTTLIRSN